LIEGKGMSTTDDERIFDCNRRDFLKVAGVGVAALSIPGMALLGNAGAASMTNVNQEMVETDVLVIGGGIAGTFAAIKAKEKGVDVTLVDKGHVGRSGKSPWLGAFTVFDPSSGQSRASYISRGMSSSDYIARKDYIEMWLDYSKAIRDDIVSWGTVGQLNHGDVFREQLRKSSVRLIERVMITELLEKDGNIVGAVGFPMEEDKAIVINAKAVVNCAGTGAFKNAGFPIGPLTSDGHVMAYRAGAEISGKELTDMHHIPVENVNSVWATYSHHFNKTFRGGPPQQGRPARQGSQPSMRPPGMGQTFGMSPPRGRPGAGRVPNQPIVFAAHEGNIPVKVKDIIGKGVQPRGPHPLTPDTSLVMGSTAGMALHRHDGIFAKDNKCASNIPGLFAAGDAMCTAGIGGTGIASSGCGVQGARAGVHAAEYAQKTKRPRITKAQLTKVKKRIFEPREREKGYSPAWVTQVLQSIMTPYYVLYVKKKERLEAALVNIEFLGDHFTPKLLANDTHQLRLAHETKNMILNAEMKLRASLFRTESRGAHYREDYPARNDKQWLCWVIIKQDGDNMKLYKKPLPESWKPDPSIPYERRYRQRFPGELEYLRKNG